ncbi:hypothetical protein EDC01DRAFT_680187 [Geopyxis carbonaria]|nr:hypothetical protein EDC01DRAFT_680187 [Geopyxis carbonaria]
MSKKAAQSQVAPPKADTAGEVCPGCKTGGICRSSIYNASERNEKKAMQSKDREGLYDHPEKEAFGIFTEGLKVAKGFHLAKMKIKYKKENDDYEKFISELIAKAQSVLSDFAEYTASKATKASKAKTVPEGRRGCEKECEVCSVCRQRRVQKPDTKDLQFLQTVLCQIFNLTYQNFFHRIARRIDLDEAAHTDIVQYTPIHTLFAKQTTEAGPPQSLEYFEREGSETVELPLQPGTELPKGCPAKLLFIKDQAVIDAFIDKTICHVQGLHEKHECKVHYTTSLQPTTELCKFCEWGAEYLLPALVAPYFLRRTFKIMLSLGEVTDVAFTYPLFPSPVQLPEPPKSAKNPKGRISTQATLDYQPVLLPFNRPRFKPADNPDPTRHPYSYFLKKNPEERSTLLLGKVEVTRKSMGITERVVPGKHPEWICTWPTGEESGVDLEAMQAILDDGESLPLQLTPAGVVQTVTDVLSAKDPVEKFARVVDECAKQLDKTEKALKNAVPGMIPADTGLNLTKVHKAVASMNAELRKAIDQETEKRLAALRQDKDAAPTSPAVKKPLLPSQKAAEQRARKGKENKSSK